MWFVIKILENRNDSLAGVLDKKSGFTFSRRVSSLGKKEQKEQKKKNKEVELIEGRMGTVSSRRFLFLPRPSPCSQRFVRASPIWLKGTGNDAMGKLSCLRRSVTQLDKFSHFYDQGKLVKGYKHSQDEFF